MPTSGRPGHLTRDEQAALESFRAKAVEAKLYSPARHDDACLCRFLRARKWDVSAAFAMFTDAENWRREFHVDELYTNFTFPEKEAVNELYPQFYHKTDKDGRPVYIEQLGKVDLKALYKFTTPERLMQKLVVEYEKFQRERLPVCSTEHGQVIETSCTIMDLKNVGVSQFWKVSGYVQQASRIGQYYYPETMGKFYIINAPYIFTTVWSVVKGWLDPVTVEKIKILGNGYEHELAQQIPMENLPAYLGGKCHCPEGCSLSDAGPWTTPQGQAVIQHAEQEREHRALLFRERGGTANAAASVAKESSLIPTLPSVASGASSTIGPGTNPALDGPEITKELAMPDVQQPKVVQPAGLAADPHVPTYAHLGDGGPIVAP